MTDHKERLEDTNHEVKYLGELEGVAVRESEDGDPHLFLHGSERSCGVEVSDAEFADGLSRAGVEIEAVLEGGSVTDTDN